MPVTPRWHVSACDDAATGALAEALGAAAAGRPPPLSARPRRSRARFAIPRPAAGASARSDAARRHAAGDRSDSRRHRAARADRDPRRLRRRRHHLDGHPAPGAGIDGRRGRALHPGAADRWLRPAAGGDRAAARAGCRAGHFSRLRHQGRRGRRARARAGRRSDRHRPPRARRGAAAGVRGHQSEARRLLVPGQIPRRRRCRPEGRPGAVPGDWP